MFELMDAYSQSAVIKVIGVGGGRRQRGVAHGGKWDRGRGLHLHQYRCAGAQGLQDQDLAADRRQHHQGTGRGAPIPRSVVRRPWRIATVSSS